MRATASCNDQLDAIVLVLDDLAAVGADQVVVVVAVDRAFITGMTVAELLRVGDPELGEKLHRAVDRGGADLGVGAAHGGQQLIDVQVPTASEKNRDDQRPLTRLLQPPLLQVALKDSFGRQRFGDVGHLANRSQR